MSTWERFRLRRIARIVGGSTPTSEPENWDGDVPFFTPPDLRPVHGGVVMETGRTLTNLGVTTGSTWVRAGSVILSKRAPIGYVARLGVDGAFNQGCLVLEPDPHTADARFLTWVLSVRSDELNVLGRGTTFLELSAADLASIEVRLPRLREQQAIADYLDRETAKIDTLVEEQQQLVEMLRERRISVVTQAATQGIDDAPLVDSGNLYLGAVPAHWTVSRFSREVAINGGQVDPRDEPWADMVLVAPNHVQANTGRIVGRETAREQGADSGKYLANAGQLIYSKIRPALNKVTVATEDCLTSADMYAMSSIKGDDHRYLMYFMLARPFHTFATLTSLRVKMPKINREELGEAPWLRPPPDEQRRIVDYLDEQTAKIDMLIAESESFIDLARERRSALITAAVTGQIDVRNEVA